MLEQLVKQMDVLEGLCVGPYVAGRTHVACTGQSCEGVTRVRSNWMALVALYALLCAVFVSCMVIDGSSCTAHQQSIEGEDKGSVPSGLRCTILLYPHG